MKVAIPNFKNAILVIIAFFSLQYKAQQWLEEPYLEKKSGAEKDKPYNFYEIQKAFYKYAAEQYEKDTLTEGENRGHFKGYNQFKRWEWFNEQRVFANGEFPDVDMYMHEFENKASQRMATSVNSNTANWTNMGFSTIPGGSSAGAGRINCMAFMPGNSNTFFIGTACGGVWKTTNGGNTWAVLNTDNLPSLSIASIVIDPINTNNIYIATGDNFAGIPNYFKTLQGHFSAGIYKSTDGGLSWNVTGLSYNQSQLMYPQEMIIDPVNPAILMLVSNTGIWRTTNSGTNWTNVQAGNFYSIAFNPLNRNVVYASNGTGLWRSNNNGVNWVYKAGGYSNGTAGRVTLGVTEADTSYIYLWGPTAGFKRSINGGTSFSTMTSPDAMTVPYGYYDRGVTVSHTNKMEVHVAGVSTAKTLNGGTSWAASSDYTSYLNANYIHQDAKRMYYEPGSGSKIYAVTDGGIFVSLNDGTNWTNISHGLQISEIYRIAGNPNNSDTVYYGTQDCATNRWDGTNTTITQVYGSDGFQPLVDYTDSRIVFAQSPNGNLQKSTDFGQNFVLASPGQAMWNAPYVMNPKNHLTMYFGAKLAVRKTTVGATFGSWYSISTGKVDSVIALAITKADTNYIYAAKLRHIVRTKDGGNDWDTITGTIPTQTGMLTSAGISYIVVSPTDPNKLYVTLSGYVAGTKVYMSANAGNTWTNYSGTLPNVPVNCITYVEGSKDAVYVGTDLGVYYRDSTMNDWLPFNTGLPNVIINQLEIYYPTMKLRAGTYGRGLWQSDLVMPVSAFTTPAINCTGTAINFTDQTSGSPTTWSWTFAGGIPATSTVQNPSVSFSTPGVHNVTLISTNTNGADTITIPVTVNTLPSATVSAGGPTTFCQGNSVTLSSSAGSSYLWSNGATTQTTNISTNGNYSVTVTAANGCSATSSATAVTVNTLPAATISAGGPTTFCQGNSVTLSSSAGNSYLWSNGATTQTTIISTSGNYSVTVTGANGCSATSSVTSVTENIPQNNLAITNNADTLFSPYNTQVYWYLVGNSAPVDSGTFYLCGLPGNYFTTGIDINGCPATSDTVFSNCITSLSQNNSSGGFGIFPNPASDQVTLSGTGLAGTELKLELKNSIGQLVYSETIIVKNEQVKKTISLSELAVGVYFLTIDQENKKTVLKIFKQN
ncbi:MAG: T9SS type A sorting domain-containing protein [Bacteroidia bacterium]|nr:T9SS type A sorting domain-containing protein [Bacteroidia bacterium]